MMEDAFDDQYVTCQKQMEEKMPAILRQEIGNNTLLAKAWQIGEDRWKKNENKSHGLPEGFRDVHGIALEVYTMNEIDIDGEPQSVYSIFNKELRSAGKSREHYMRNFHYKALHYYLTRVLQILWTGCPQKTIVFRGSTIPHYRVEPELRFGQFASSSLDPEVAEYFGTHPFFKISTCYGVMIDGFSSYLQEDEVLIPGQETFRLVNQTGKIYLLESTGELCSYFECAYIRKKPKQKVCRKLHNPKQAQHEDDLKAPKKKCVGDDGSKIL